MSKPRYLETDINALALQRNKMAFISGPRQAGKTTLAKMIGKGHAQFSYQNWDERTFRVIWTKSPNKVEEYFDLARSDQSKLLVLDEIHKSKGWKQKLKGLYDHLGEELKVMVTGSARLSVYKKGGDSLMGRYLHFRLHPFTLSELVGGAARGPQVFYEKVFCSAFTGKHYQAAFEKLSQFSGFPEPLLAEDTRILNIWRKGRLEKVVREDLRDLTRIQEIGQVEALMSLLPDKVGSPVSIASLREDLDVSFDTVKRWLKYLEELYYHFSIRPYSKSVARSLKKEPKLYLFDWTEIEDKGARFENIIASHLLKACHYWVDTGEGDFQLHYLRDKQKHEVDFLVTRNKKPWFSVECKYADTHIDPQSIKLQAQLDVPHVQLVHGPGVWRQINSKLWVMSAEKFLQWLI
jgi:uncharacterized protein